jgi:ribosomal-protein-alanine N-acetyltransferase
MIGLSVEVEGRVVGFVLYELQKNRLRIDRMAIHPDCRRSGYGTAIITKLTDKLSQQRRQELFVDVSDRDLTTHLFLKSCGFRAVIAADECYRFTYRLESQGCHAERR